MLGDKGDTPLLLNKSPATGDVGVIVDHTSDTKRDIQASSNATSLRTAPHSLYRDERWFTGKAPYAGICPGVNDSGIISSLPLPNLATSGQPELLQYFDNTWTLQETLFAGLRTRAAFYRQPDHKLRHPLIFYYGHPAAFYINKLRVAGYLNSPINAHLEALLEAGVDENSWDDLAKDVTDWPAVEEVHEYRAKVYRLAREVIATTKFATELGRPINMDDPAWAIVMAFEHDRIHLETSSVLMRELPVDLVSRHPAWPGPTAAARTSREERLLPANEMVSVPAGEVSLGKPNDFPSFGWDNEYGSQRLKVGAFQASRYLISNGEFYDFVVSGGYRERRFWSDDGWGQVRLHNKKWPRFWVLDGPAGLHEYRLRTVFDVIPMAWDWPVCVNYHEAKAFCSWRSERSGTTLRIMTEAEHHRMRDPLPDNPGCKDDMAMHSDGHQLARQGINLNLAFGSETPTDGSPLSASGFGDVFGNVWQWCEDAFAPLPGFAVHPYYEDFSTPFYEGQHQLLLGGSFIATGDEASIWGRIPFRPHFLQHSGIRLARSVAEPAGNGAGTRNGTGTRNGVRESNGTTARNGVSSYSGDGDCDVTRAFNQCMLLHYGSLAETVGPALPAVSWMELAHGFVQRVVNLLVETAQAQGLELRSALDVGCAVGGASFALTQHFSSVVGVDEDQVFIETARAMARAGNQAYQRYDRGQRVTNLLARLNTSVRPERVSFQLAEASILPTGIGSFDAVLAVDPLVDLPKEFQALESVLQQMPIRTASGKPGLIAEGRLAAVVDSELPDLTAQVDLYRDDLRVICALFRDYCFLASGYLLEPCHRRFMKSQEYGVGRPSLPKQIARPFVRCSEIAGFKPFLEFASYVLLNYRLDDPAKGMDFSNLRLVRAYEHGLDPSSSESGFILVHLSMVKLSGPLVHSTLKAFEAASKATTPLGTIEERTLLNEALSSMVQAVSNLNVLMKSIYERSKPSEYNNFRTFMFGIASESMFPNGVIYEGYNNDEPVFFRGETGANDAMIPLLDNFLQIPMPDTPLTEILHEFSEYRSCKHKAFLIFVKERSLELDIKKFALGSVAIADCEEMSDLVRESRSLWLQVLNQVREFRWRHWCLVKEYILKRSSHPTATGGSPIVTWLPNQLDAVLEDMVQVDATSREHDPRGLGKVCDGIMEVVFRQKDTLRKEVEKYCADRG
ncbi:hypothetical protein PLIIFM63780_000257 [Purpureocillium lilacinum]|nr:hypothetical protein PLIIFM63780_000257 [Purpureocillium lilacinum]